MTKSLPAIHAGLTDALQGLAWAYLAFGDKFGEKGYIQAALDLDYLIPELKKINPANQTNNPDTEET